MSAVLRDLVVTYPWTQQAYFLNTNEQTSTESWKEEHHVEERPKDKVSLHLQQKTFPGMKVSKISKPYGTEHGNETSHKQILLHPQCTYSLTDLCRTPNHPRPAREHSHTLLAQINTQRPPLEERRTATMAEEEDPDWGTGLERPEQSPKIGAVLKDPWRKSLTIKEDQRR